MKLNNYNIVNDDFKKMLAVLRLMPDATREIAIYYISKLEAYRNYSEHTGPVLYTLRHYNKYPVILEKVKSYIQKLHEQENDNDYEIGTNTYIAFMDKMAGIPEDALSSLSPLNFIRLVMSDKFKSMLFYEDFIYQCNIEKKEFNNTLTEELFKDKNIEVQSYYKMVGSIYNYLQHAPNYRFSRATLKTLSMLLAMFYFEDPNDDFNISRAFKEAFPYLDKNEFLSKVLGMDDQKFRSCIKDSFDVGDLFVNFKNELNDNDIYVSIRRLFGEKGSNGVLTNICIALGIDDDRLYDSVRKLDELKKQSISDEEVDRRYIELTDGLSIDDIQVYNIASIIYKKLYASQEVLSFHVKTPDKLATLSILLGMYLLNHKDVDYLKSDCVFLEDIIKNLNLGTILDDDYKWKDIDKRVIVFQLSNFLEHDEYKSKDRNDNPLITNLFTNGNRTLLKLLLISLDRDFDSLYQNILDRTLPERILTEEELKKTLPQFDPEGELDINSKESISNYGLKIMEYVNSIISRMLELSAQNTGESSFDEVREGIDKIYETRERKKSGLLGALGRKEQEVIVHFDYVTGLNERIDENIKRLSEQMKGYSIIETRNKLYNQVLSEYIRIAYVKREALVAQGKTLDEDSLFETTDYSVRVQMMEQKINTLESSRRIMENQYLSLGVAILSTSSVINTLSHVRSDFIPLLTSNMLISIGATSAKEANLVAKSVVDLTKSYLSDNLDSAREILGDLQVLGVPEGHIRRIEGDIETRTITDGSEHKVYKRGAKPKKDS